MIREGVKIQEPFWDCTRGFDTNQVEFVREVFTAFVKGVELREIMLRRC